MPKKARSPNSTLGPAAAAVCFSGWLGREVADGGASIRRELVDAIGADVHLALGYLARDNCDSETSCRIEERLHGLKPFTRVSVFRLPSTPELVAAMEALPHWPAIVHAFGKRCVRNVTLADGPRYDCTGLYMGNTIFSPVLGTTSSLHEFVGFQRCLSDLIGPQETQRNRPYEWLVHSRLEAVWLRPHPPLEMFDPRYVWIPNGEDYYGGYNDRHAVLARDAAKVYFGRWETIVSGDVMRIDRQLRGGKVADRGLVQSEPFLKTVLNAAGLNVRRFPAAMPLACCPENARCFAAACYTRVLPAAHQLLALMAAHDENRTDDKTALMSRVSERAFVCEDVMKKLLLEKRDPSSAHHGAMQTPRLVDLEAGRSSCSWPSGSNSTNLDEPSVVRGKYRDEVEMAIQHALALSLPGARYKTIFPYGEVHGPTGVCRPATPVGQPHRKGAPPFGGRPCGAVVIVVPVQSRRTFDAFIGTLRTAIKMRNPLRTFSTSSYVRWSLS